MQAALAALDGRRSGSRDAAVEARDCRASSRIRRGSPTIWNRIGAVARDRGRNCRERSSDGEIQGVEDQTRGAEARLRDAREAERLYGQAEVLRPNARPGQLRKARPKGASATTLRHAARKARRHRSAARRRRGLAAIAQRPSRPRRRAQAARRARRRVAAGARPPSRAGQRSTWRTRRIAGDAGLRRARRRGAAGRPERAESERDYQAFIANEKIAATLAAREQEMAALPSDIEQRDRGLTAAARPLADLEGHYDTERHRRALGELDGCANAPTQLATQIDHTARAVFEAPRAVGPPERGARARRERRSPKGNGPSGCARRPISSATSCRRPRLTSPNPTSSRFRSRPTTCSARSRGATT